MYIYYIFLFLELKCNKLFCKLFALVLFISFFLLLSFKLFSFSSHFAFRLFRGARGGRGADWEGVGICMVWLMHLWPIYVYVYYMYVCICAQRAIEQFCKAKESALKSVACFQALAISV